MMTGSCLNKYISTSLQNKLSIYSPCQEHLIMFQLRFMFYLKMKAVKKGIFVLRFYHIVITIWWNWLRKVRFQFRNGMLFLFDMFWQLHWRASMEQIYNFEGFIRYFLPSRTYIHAHTSTLVLHQCLTNSARQKKKTLQRPKSLPVSMWFCCFILSRALPC